jgi:hypothetical protein
MIEPIVYMHKVHLGHSQRCNSAIDDLLDELEEAGIVRVAPNDFKHVVASTARATCSNDEVHPHRRLDGQYITG